MLLTFLGSTGTRNGTAAATLMILLLSMHARSMDLSSTIWLDFLPDELALLFMRFSCCFQSLLASSSQ